MLVHSEKDSVINSPLPLEEVATLPVANTTLVSIPMRRRKDLSPPYDKNSQVDLEDVNQMVGRMKVLIANLVGLVRFLVKVTAPPSPAPASTRGRNRSV